MHILIRNAKSHAYSQTHSMNIRPSEQICHKTANVKPIGM